MFKIFALNIFSQNITKIRYHNFYKNIDNELNIFLNTNSLLKRQ